MFATILSSSFANACPWADRSFYTEVGGTYFYQVNADCTSVVVNLKNKPKSTWALTYKKKSLFNRKPGWEYGANYKITLLDDGKNVRAKGSWGSNVFPAIEN